MFSEGHTLVLSRLASSHISGLEEVIEAFRKTEIQREKRIRVRRGQVESDSGQSVWIRVTGSMMKKE